MATMMFPVEGRVTCDDVTPDKRVLLESVSLDLNIVNVRFPLYTHGSIHRRQDNTPVAEVEAAR